MGKKKKKDARSDELAITSDEDWVNLKNIPGTIIIKKTTIINYIFLYDMNH